MNDLLDLLDRATDDLPWEPERLVAGAVVAGRGRRRRRRVGTALTGVAAAALLGTGLTYATQGGDAGSRAVDAASHAPSANPSSRTTPSSPAPTPTRWRIGVSAARVPATFASLLPGVITTVPNKEMDDANPIIDFRWNGFAVRVGVTSDSYITGQRVTDPKQRCEEFGSSGDPCTPGRLAGSYEQSTTWTGPAQDGGVTTRFITVYFAEGWDVTVMEANAADFKGGPTIAADLPLTLDQLRDAAYNGVWFE